ncbi:MAG TPA: histidine phosphatase family protein [Sphingomonas sp.]
MKRLLHRGISRIVAVTFLLIRHAAHVHLDKIFSGRLSGVPLSDVGRAQADRLGVAASRERLDRILCSPLDRTRQTADAVAAAHGLAAEPDDALVEIDMGDWTGRELGSFVDEPAWTAWNTERGTARIPGGETMAEAQARIVALLDRVAATDDGRTVAIVSHADMIRGAVAHALGLPLDNLLRFDVGPASVTRIVWGDWGARLMSLNEQPGEVER